jgi:hypothetical protein
VLLDYCCGQDMKVHEIAAALGMQSNRGHVGRRLVDALQTAAETWGLVCKGARVAAQARRSMGHARGLSQSRIAKSDAAGSARALGGYWRGGALRQAGMWHRWPTMRPSRTWWLQSRARCNRCLIAR